MKNTISVRGNLTKDLEFDEKKLLAKGCVAINEKETQNEQSVQRTIFLDFIIKGELAKQYQHAKRGDTVSLQGRLMQGKFNQNGQKRLFLKMQAECVKIIDKQTLKRIELFESYPRPDYVYDESGKAIGVRRFKDGVVVYFPKDREKPEKL